MKSGHLRLRDALLARREAVARLRLAGCGSVRAITRRLAEIGVVKPDGKPWGRMSVQKDIEALRAGWREQAGEAFNLHVDEELATILFIRQRAFEMQDWNLALATHDRVSKLLGLAAPSRAEVALAAPPIDDQTVGAAVQRVSNLIEKRAAALARGTVAPERPQEARRDMIEHEAASLPVAEAKSPERPVLDVGRKPVGVSMDLWLRSQRGSNR